MKMMSDRKMDMKMSGVDSDGYFPSEVKHHKFAKSGELSDHKYPDTEEMIHADQNQFVKEANKAKAKAGYRH